MNTCEKLVICLVSLLTACGGGTSEQGSLRLGEPTEAFTEEGLSDDIRIAIKELLFPENNGALSPVDCAEINSSVPPRYTPEEPAFVSAEHELKRWTEPAKRIDASSHTAHFFPVSCPVEECLGLKEAPHNPSCAPPSSPPGRLGMIFSNGKECIAGDRLAREHQWHLCRHKEPSLFGSASGTPEVETYRFSSWGSWNRMQSFSLRIERTSNGAVLFSKLREQSTEQGSVVTEVREVSSEQWARFKEILNESDFWNTPTEAPFRGKDGFTHLLEARVGDRYHVVWRHGYPYNYFEAACHFLTFLAGIDHEEFRNTLQPSRHL